MSEETTLRLAGVIRESIVDGPGIRFAVFSQGCPHHCKGCHNEQTHDFNLGYDCDINKIIYEIDKNPLISGVTFTGGEPFCQAKAFYELGLLIKERDLNIVAYSGYTFEQLKEMAKDDESISNLLGIIDILIDGPFILEEKDLTLEFRGSKNQRIIKMGQNNSI
ncbi:anaerobic ribonucleoside-triphosphate reductase activating protein [Anaerovorax odorimutans]|uniref:anaerobic ribonucleoside-triphosphate reductase activating protein n=1 Tax=Anaerovorax odorimutans TaxID=109327 RepID=UPI0004051137|nr:anaerobic ribonucleoside-triphosphate reductase activating protein [Anaerovorax odorimutans]